MVYTTNHTFVPAAYMGIVGSGRIFSGLNPAYTLPGKALLPAVRSPFFAESPSRDCISGKEHWNHVMLVHPSFIQTALAAIK